MIGEFIITEVGGTKTMERLKPLNDFIFKKIWISALFFIGVNCF
jgi:hypothetical protein